MRKIKCAVFGAGSMARLHSRNAEAGGQAEVVGVCSRSSSSAAALSEELQREVPFYRDFYRMLDEAQPEALLVCVPPYAHKGEVEAAAERGVHLFLEKPLALHLERAASMCAAVEKSGVITQVDFHHRFHPLVHRIKQLIEGGIGGKPLLMQTRFFCNSLHTAWWRDKDRSGGQLLEQVIHLFDLILYFLGPINRVNAFRDTLCHQEQLDYTVEDTTVASMRADSGAMVSLAASNCGIPQQWEAAFHLICEKITGIYSSIEAGRIVWTGDPNEAPDLTIPRIYTEPHKAALVEFLDALQNKKTTSVTLQAAYTAQELVMRVIESADNGQYSQST